MARFVSFAVLVAILLAIAFLFFRVMAEFILPIFFAALLVILFRPLHRRIVAECRGHQYLAAALTTAALLVLFLGPLVLIIFQASSEGLILYSRLKASQIDMLSIAESIAAVAHTVGLNLQPSELSATLTGRIQEWLAPVALSTTQFVGNLLLGLLVTIVSFYFFLIDGARMTDTVMDLLPLDRRYQQELIEEFLNISRAVVLAMIATAVVQGLLAGIGFYFAGLHSVFLLIVLTMLLSMVPFVGAVSVWLPISLWLIFYDHRVLAGVLLAIYGASIVSTIDNIIKPLILHGASNLHPLLALLSVLGGVKALGPIGIFVGPMAVALLLTVLKMVRRELDEMSRRERRSGDSGPPDDKKSLITSP